MKTIAEIRQSFWNENYYQKKAEYKIKNGRTDNDFRADVRMAFADHVDMLVKYERITEALAGRVTLG